MIDRAQALRWYTRQTPQPPREALARTACEAMQYADAIGFPVVLTAVAAEPAGPAGVASGLSTTESVRRAYRAMLDAVQAPVAGVLVQRVATLRST